MIGNDKKRSFMSFNDKDFKGFTFRSGPVKSTTKQNSTFWDTNSNDVDVDEFLGIDTETKKGKDLVALAGYKRAVGIAEWVFQADSDNEISPNQFSALWSRRQGQDAVIAWRQGRNQTTVRRLVTFFARVTTKVLFRCHLRDVNIPFRLIRSETLTILLEKIPSDTFAPNIALSGALSLMNYQVEECPVVFNERIVGESSLSNLGAVRKGGRALLELIKISRVFP